jgi:hypothetical protein
VINNRPPEFLQPFTCDPKTGFRSGNAEVFAKNTGKTEAVDVLPLLWLDVVPERKTGIPLYDNFLMHANCSGFVRFKMDASIPATGKEYPFEIRQSVASLPPISDSEPVQLYATSCIYYSNPEDNGAHAVCDTYRMTFPGNIPLDQFFGTPRLYAMANQRMGSLLCSSLDIAKNERVSLETISSMAVSSTPAYPAPSRRSE